MTVHRIQDDRPPPRADLWTPARQAWLAQLEAGPAGVSGFRGAECMRFGWCDWIRDERGRIIYGDRRYVLTEAGRAQLATWREEHKT